MEEIIERFGDLSFSEKPRVPKGKRTAYGFFMQQFSADMKTKGEKSNGLGHFSKSCSLKWKELSDKEKEKYQRKAKEDIIRYETEMKEYDKEKYEYDQIIDEMHDKGYLRHLEDKRHLTDLKDLNIARTADKPAAKRVNNMNFRSLNKKNTVQNNTDSDDNNSHNDTIREMNGKTIVPKKPNRVDDEDTDEEHNPNDSEDDEEEGEDRGSDSEESDEESEGNGSEDEEEEDEESESGSGEDDQSESGSSDGDDREADEEESESSDDEESQPKNKMRLSTAKPKRRLF